MIDHPAYSAIPLFAFLPILAAGRSRHNGSPLCLALGSATVFVAAAYSIYGPLIMVAAFWALGGLFRFLPVHTLSLFNRGNTSKEDKPSAFHKRCRLCYFTFTKFFRVDLNIKD